MKDMAERFTYDIAISIVPHWECQTSTGVGALAMDGIGSSACHAWRPISPSLNFCNFSFKRKVNEYRMYDPVMSSFLSPDNYVQSPNNSQNFNRYSYCLNNPLKYIDPSGESIIGSFIGGIALGIIQNGINNSYYDRPFFENWEAGAAAGGMQAMFSIGIGELTQGINKPWMQSLARAGLHAGSCALNAKFDNRDVLAAAAAGFVGSIVTGGIEYHTRGLQNYHRIPAMIAGGAISSGVASEMMGGDFMDGFYDGLFVAGFNHAMHLVAEGGNVYIKRLKWLQNFKMENQTDWGLCKMLSMASCKYKCLEAIGNYFGSDKTASYYRSVFNSLECNYKDTGHKVTMGDLIKASGFDFTECKANADNMMKWGNYLEHGCPIMLLLDQEGGEFHSVVVTGIQQCEEGWLLQLSDPAGNSGIFNLDELHIYENSGIVFRNPFL